MKRHPRYTLSRGDAMAIRRAASNGATVYALAVQFGVGVHTVRAVLRYARFRPELTQEQHATLARFASELGVTRDDALDLALRRGFADETGLSSSTRRAC